jgi:hypothetical protein
MILRPSFANGFAPRDGQAIWPELWRGCVGAWNPGLGPTGLRLYDWSPYKNHGTLTNMAANIAWSRIAGHHALDFDYIEGAARQAVELPSRVTIGGHAKVSISMWVQFQAATVNNAALYFESSESAGFTKFGLFQLSSNQLFFQARDTAAGASYSITVSGPTTKLSHVCGNYDADTDRMELFVDGILVGTNTTAKGVLHAGTTSAPIAVGAFTSANPAVQYSANAIIVDVLLYRGRILHPSEIRLLATRPGIAYEMAPRRWSAAMIEAYRRRTQYAQLVGGGII